MSDWESDKPADWGDKPVEPEKEGKPLFGRKSPKLPPESGRDWKLIEKLVMSLQAEQRRSRRWGIFFRLAICLGRGCLRCAAQCTDCNSGIQDLWGNSCSG